MKVSNTNKFRLPGVLLSLLLLLVLATGCTPAELPSAETVHAAYQQLIAETEDAVSYVYWDLNDDGVDELALKTGNKEGNYRFKFYAYLQDKATLIGDEIGAYSYLAHDGLHVIVAGDHDGQEWAYRVTFINTLYRYQMEYDQAVRNNTPVQWPTIIEMIPLDGGQQSGGNESQQTGSNDVPTGPVGPAGDPNGTVTVSFAPEVVKTGETFTGREALPAIDYIVGDPQNAKGLSTEKYSFSYGVAKNGTPHNTTVNNQTRFDGFGTNALAWDNKTNAAEEKVLYLTFDCGYVYGDLTERILDTLKEKEVPAAFFCTLDFLEDAPELAARMINEGHILGNHSVSHPSDCAALSREDMATELLGVENYLRVNFGYSSKYFRFPTGAYSENALELVDSVGYRSIFWSIAHADWDPQNQPGVQKSFDTVTSRLHPGAVILLHSTSPDNADILADFIDFARAEGYVFRSLDQYPAWN